MSQPSYPPQPEYGWAPPPPPPRRRWPRVLIWVVALPVLGVAIGGGAALLTKDDGVSASPAACKTALAANYRKAVADGGEGPQMGEPAACKGLDQATLERLTGEVVSEYLDSPEAKELFEQGLESAAPSP